jgi:NAD(P)-dependent dehydrogenase (short-subunit alcohol dehydrogenase family)
MQRQRLGGRLILNASKNVPAPGADFAAYSASKAAAVQVARVAALELAPHGILVNMVHPDGVFEDAATGTSSGLWDEVGAARMRSRGLSPAELREHYRKRNLLGIAVHADHVAEAVAFFAEGRTPTTGAALTVDGGLKETFYR